MRNGYLGQMVFCDKCLDPSKGLAFRLARVNTRVGDLYDLCVPCYCEGDDEHTASHFHCNIPSGNIDQEADHAKSPLATRKDSQQYTLVGLFKGAGVKFQCQGTTMSDEGTILNIVHEKGNYDLRKAKYFDSCAEVKLKDGSLKYWEAGSGGHVELMAVKPGTAPFTVPIDHFIKLGDKLVNEMVTYKTKLVKIDGKEYCFKRFLLSDGTCYSLTISGTTLAEITDFKIWQDCKELRIVILLMNKLVKLPQKLEDYAASIELVCLQNNNFQTVPSIIFKLTNIKHLNLHGNNISEFPEELNVLTQLERLKFGDNRLYSLPDIFSAFTKLIEITFNNNFLTRLPPSFSQLEKLESIDLTDNSFTCIPVQLLKLPNLKSIYMRYNRIHRLSPLEDEGGKDTLNLVKGSKMATLRLRGNPVFERFPTSSDSSVPLKPTLEVLKANFAKFKQEPGPIPKAIRVLLLGSCGAGKTCIRETLSYGKYVTPTSENHHDHTVGIDRFSIPVKISTEDGKSVVELRLWDFAGEKSYVMMNKLFVTNETLIWIAVNFETYTDANFQKHVGNWIEQILTKTARPIVWVVGTRIDKCLPEDVEKKKESIRERIELECDVFKQKLSEEKDKLKNNPSGVRSQLCMRNKMQDLEHLHDSNVPCFIKKNLVVLSVSNTYGAEGFVKLKQCVDSVLPSLYKTLTIVQQKAIDKIRHKAEERLFLKKAPIFTKEEVLNIIVPELDKEEAESLLKYLHQVGTILMYDFLSDDAEIILDVDWLINSLKQIFHHDFKAMMQKKKKSRHPRFHCFSENDIEEAINLQQTTGRIKDEVLNALWNLNELPRKQLIKFLECVGLVYETIESAEYLFPWLLAMKKNLDFKLHAPENEQPHIMILYYLKPCIPTCFIQELVVKCLKYLVCVEKLYENGFLIYKTYKATKFSIQAMIKRDDDSLCGHVYLLIKPKDTFDSTTVNLDLWDVTFKIIKLMEKILCFWTFYGNINRKIRCPCCKANYWDLHLKRPSLATRAQRTLHCKKCENNTPSISLITPPEHLLLKEDEFFDTQEHTEEDVPQGVQPTEPQTEASCTDTGLTPARLTAPQYELDSPPSYEESVDNN